MAASTCARVATASVGFVAWMCQSRQRVRFAQEFVDQGDDTVFIACPELAQPFTESTHLLELTGIPGAVSRELEPIEELGELFDGSQLIAPPAGSPGKSVDQRRGGHEGNLGVMCEKHVDS